MSEIAKYRLDQISEIRIRANKPVFIAVKGKYIKLSDDSRFKLSQSDIEQIILKLTKHSVYAYQETIRKGYIVGDSGERVGICGRCVMDEVGVKTINYITSLNIRLPREVKGFADFIDKDIFRGEVKNLLIISPPGMGKTTLVRDLARIISSNYDKNVLVIDEKSEISGGNKFDLGQRADIMIGADKNFGFSTGIYNMRPDVIIADELTTASDVDGAILACRSGVNIIATCHGRSVKSVKDKKIFFELFDGKIMDCCIVLSNKNGIGTVEEIVRL